MPESVGLLQISMMAMVSHCSQHSLQQSTASITIRAKFAVQSCQSPIGSVAKAVVCNASDPGSSPLLSNRSFFSIPGKNKFQKIADSAPLAHARGVIGPRA